MTVYLTGKEPLIQAIASAAFPSYRGRTFKLCTAETVNVKNGSYWDGGSRSVYRFLRLSDMAVHQGIGQVHPYFDREKDAATPDDLPLPDGVVCVEHCVFCGKDMGLTIYAAPATLNPAVLAPTVELTPDERKVLEVTRSYKNTYGGRSDIRFHESGLSREAWNTASEALTARGMLAKNGSITISGRNALGGR